ncbi:BI1-like protein [Selaginella moellendorffii]|uniref:BI1-like protein n=1 Tax=Selaginella moellendorffii TaxID=88036 RepID=UPI000D1CF226|nr:BI1-like protein [Selaginella moellendorffii]|eukprot:XP_024532232.1 BI1-like protein [Selaginella moellendorffii]
MAGGSGDIESARSTSDLDLRWGFIRKVYGILMSQLVLTAIVAGIVVAVKPINRALGHTPWISLALGVFALILLCPLYIYRQKHPLNLILLGFFTILLSLTVGFVCAYTRGEIVLQALILTATITIGLTLFTFWAVNRGYDFGFLGPLLFASVLVLIVWGIIQAFFPIVRMLTSVYTLLGALIFSLYIVYDTYLLIQRFDYDEYVWAAVNLYIDVINLFLYILQFLRGNP